MRTYVYIDGFNLYYGCLRGTPHRWLNLAALCRHLLPGHQVLRLKYFTAHVGPRLNDPGQSLRQQLYLRALQTIPRLEIHLGHYLTHVVRMPLAKQPPTGPRFVRVIRTEEKGSDVNIATQLLSDAYEDAFDVAVLITNDSDLLSPVRLVRDRLQKKVGILNPREQQARGDWSQPSMTR